MKNIITIQHTEAVHHINGMVGSWTDWALTNTGRRHAANIGRNLGQFLKGKAVKIYSSDLLRASQTVAPLAQDLNLAIEYRTDLREQHLGTAALGKSRSWLAAHQAPVRSIDDRAFPDGESARDVWQRMAAFSEEIMATADQNIVIAAHGFCLPIFFAAWFKLDVERIGQSSFAGLPGGVSLLSQNERGRRSIVRLNDLSFLQD